jgi:hypothetical protein
MMIEEHNKNPNNILYNAVMDAVVKANEHINTIRRCVSIQNIILCYQLPFSLSTELLSL